LHTSPHRRNIVTMRPRNSPLSRRAQ
jgi:hypothetical protein